MNDTNRYAAILARVNRVVTNSTPTPLVSMSCGGTDIYLYGVDEGYVAGSWWSSQSPGEGRHLGVVYFGGNYHDSTIWMARQINARLRHLEPDRKSELERGDT